MTEQEKSYELVAGTKAGDLARVIRDTQDRYDAKYDALRKQADEMYEQRRKELTDQMQLLLDELGLDGDPNDYGLDASYLPEHGRAYLQRREPQGLLERIASRAASDLVN